MHVCDMTHSYVRHNSFICVTWLTHMCDMTRHTFCSSWVPATTRIPVSITAPSIVSKCSCEEKKLMSHLQLSHICRDEICYTYKWGTSHIWMSHVTHKWGTSHIWVGHVTDMIESRHTWITQMHDSCHIWMSHVIYEWVVSHMNESCHIWMTHVTYEWVMSYMNDSCHIWMTHVTYEWLMSHMNDSCHSLE